MNTLVIVGLVICGAVGQVSPPVWPERFHQTFVESYNSTHMHISAKYYYDSAKGYTRIDRLDGRFDMVCSSIMPNVSTPCTVLIRDKKRYMVYP